jgi:hypothetical protein
MLLFDITFRLDEFTNNWSNHLRKAKLSITLAFPSKATEVPEFAADMGS